MLRYGKTYTFIAYINIYASEKSSHVSQISWIFSFVLCQQLWFSYEFTDILDFDIENWINQKIFEAYAIICFVSNIRKKF